MRSPPLVLLVAVEKSLDDPLRLAQRLRPAVEQSAPLLGELVRSLGRAGQIRAPLGGHEALALERAQQPVEIAHVDPPLAGDLRESLDQLVSVQRPLAQEQ